nr:Alstrom syndrome protein 1 isoform X2 [Paramormyrops kingsleyae]
MESSEGLRVEEECRPGSESCTPESPCSPRSATHLSSSTSAVSLGEVIANHARQSIGFWCPLPGVEDTGLLTEASISNMAQASPWPAENCAHQGSPSFLADPVTVAGDSSLRPPGGASCSFQLEFQDSHLSPALPLLPANYGKVHSLLEDTVFHHTALEFVALRGSPDISAASETERLSIALQGDTGMCEFPALSLSELSQGRLDTDHASLSVHTGPIALASGEDASSSCSLSQHTLSPMSGDDDDVADCVPVILEKDLVPDGSQSGTESQHSNSDGGSPDAGSQEKLQEEIPTEENNSNGLHKQLCHENDRIQSESEPEENQSHLPRNRQSVTSNFGLSAGRESITTELPYGVNKADPRWSAGFSFERGHSGKEPSSSGNHTTVEGSFVGCLAQPVYQSTPFIFPGILQAAVPPSLGKLSAVESGVVVSLATANEARNVPSKPTQAHAFDNSSTVLSPSPLSLQRSGKIQSLPSLSYMEKVGAWNVNQASGKSYSDLALHSPRRNLAASFSGTSASAKDSLSLPRSGGSHSLPLAGHFSTTGKEAQPTRALQSLPKPDSGSGTGCLSPSLIRNLATSDSDLLLETSEGQTPQIEQRQSEPAIECTKILVNQSVLQECKAKVAQEGTAESGDLLEIQKKVEHLSEVDLHHFSNVSSNQALQSVLISSLDSYQGKQKLAASPSAVSSVPSLEVDTYTHWMTDPSTPVKDKEMNIDERIPMYLRNLGIDQSPSTILTPFVSMGLIREPEFSPTDFCTIKDSTPTKSTLPSEGNTSEKGEFSRSSVLSLGSSASIPLSLDSFQPDAPSHIPQKDRCLSQCSLQAAIHPLGASLDPLPQQPLENETLCEGQHPVPEISQQASSEGSKITEHAQEGRFQSSKAETQNTQDRVSSTDQLPGLSVTDSSVGCRTLHELLNKTGSTVSERPSLSSSSATMWGSENSLLCIQNKLGSFAGSLASSGNCETTSLLGGKSSSDSLLIADGQRETSSREPFRSSMPSTDQLTATRQAAAHRTGIEVEAGPSSVVSISGQPAGFLSDKSVRREPEGCSAVVPDQALPVSVSVPAEGCPEADMQSQEVALLSKASSSASIEMRPASGSREADQNAESDSGSADVLAARVASLLRNESPATVASSGASFADEEERRAREWIRLKVLGQQCEPLGLNIQDRQRIEEIKRELLLCTRRQTKSQLSSETDSSTQSSRDGLEAEPRAQAECFTALKTAEHRLSDQLQQLSRTPSHSGVRFDSSRRRDLEARVREITHRETLTLSGAGTPSINLTSHHHFPFSSTITPASAQPHNSGLSSETREPAVVQNFGITTQDSLDTEPDPQAGCMPPIRSTPGHSSTKDTGAMERNETGSPSDLEVHSNLLTTGTQDSFYADLLLASEKKNVSWISTRDTEQRKHPSDSVSPLAAVSQLPKFSTGTSFGMICSSNRQMSKSLPDVRRSLTSQKPCVVPLHVVPLASSSSSISSSTKIVPSDLPLTLTPRQPSGNTSEFSPVTRSQEDGSTSVKELPADQPSGSSSQIARGMNVDFMKHNQPSTEQSSYFPATGMASITFGPQKGQQSVRRQDPETAGASVQITTCFPQEESRSTRPTLPQSSSVPQKMMSAPLSIQTPAVPVLLPYKPHGSSELFYMPQAGVPLSHVHSGAPLESCHPGWDASAPKLRMEVLSSSEQKVNNTIAITDVEGTYSLQRQGSDVHQGSAMQGLHLNENGGSYCSQRWESLSLERNTHASPSAYNSPSNPHGGKQWLPNRDPSVEHMVFKQSQDQDECAPLLGEDDNADNPEPFHRTGREGFAAARCSLVSGKQGGSSLDELRQRFRQGWSLRGTCSSHETEKSLLERLERLSRLIHSTGLELERANQLHGIREGQQPVGLRGRGETAGQERRAAMEPVRKEWASREGREETKKAQGTKTEGDRVRRTETGQGVRKGAEKGESSRLMESRDWSSRMSRNDQQPVQLAWGGHGSLRSTDTPPASRHRCPAERDASGHTSGETDVSVQTESGDTTASTIDTARLVRAFGPQRVNGGLERLHSAIDRQREGREQRRGRKGSSRYVSHALGQAHSTNESATTPESVLSSSSSGHAHPPHPNPTHGQRTVKHLSKGIQAGNLEIVTKGTRKHTRDVGTNVPSPRLVRAIEVMSEGAVLITKGGKGEHRTPPKHQTISNERRSRRSQQMHFPRGVSWFVPADDLKARSKKENRPDSAAPALASGLAWFEAYTKTKPWREPLRERQVQEEPVGSRPKTLGELITSTKTSKVPCGLIRITLQEALEMRRPDFISRSQERMKRLGLQVEERRLQAIFAQERENLFNQPTNVLTHPQPSGPPACARRAVPKKEMFMRSKQMYSQLPEVRRRKEEERRKAEYHSYRLKAQLYKTKITNRILGRKTPWQ